MISLYWVEHGHDIKFNTLLNVTEKLMEEKKGKKSGEEGDESGEEGDGSDSDLGNDLVISEHGIYAKVGSAKVVDHY